MQQRIRQYMPDGTGSGNKQTMGSMNPNDDDLGSASLGAANIGSSAGDDDGDNYIITGDSGPITSSNLSNEDRPSDYEDDLSLADTEFASSTDVGFGGDMGNSAGTLDDYQTTSLNSSPFNDNNTNAGAIDALAGGTAGAMYGISDSDDLNQSASAGLGSMSGSGMDPNLSQLPQPEPSTGRQSSGKTALVTGASSGIGRELANLFAKDGYNLVLVARSDDSLQRIGQEYEQQFGIQTTIISRDLTDPNAPEEVYAETQRQGLTIDVLVNDAGVGEYGMFATESDLQKELAIIQLNISSLVHLTKLYLKDMVQRNEGKILMLGSIASVMPNPLMAVYGATKAFVYSFSEALRNELKGRNVTVTVLMPPATDTDFFNKAGASHTVAQEQARAMSPAEVAKAGYDALMQGRDKVAAGFKTKLMAAASHIMPDQMITQNARNLMKSQEEAQQERQKSILTFAVGALVLGGLWLLTRGRTYENAISTDDKARYRYKTSKAKDAIEDAVDNTSRKSRSLRPGPVDSVVDSVKGTYHNAKAAVEEALA